MARAAEATDAFLELATRLELSRRSEDVLEGRFRGHPLTLSRAGVLRVGWSEAAGLTDAAVRAEAEAPTFDVHFDPRLRLRTFLPARRLEQLERTPVWSAAQALLATVESVQLGDRALELRLSNLSLAAVKEVLSRAASLVASLEVTQPDGGEVSQAEAVARADRQKLKAFRSELRVALVQGGALFVTALGVMALAMSLEAPALLLAVAGGALAAAWLVDRALRCPRCGSPIRSQGVPAPFLTVCGRCGGRLR